MRRLALLTGTLPSWRHWRLVHRRPRRLPKELVRCMDIGRRPTSAVRPRPGGPLG